MASIAGTTGKVCGRNIWSNIKDSLKYRAGRLYDAFYHAQYNSKYALIFIFPAFVWNTRFRTDTQLGYYVYINEENLYPNKDKNLFDTKWTNGRKMYLSDKTTVKDLLLKVYQGKENDIPENIKVGCRGRMFEENDNLAMAVRAFCKYDPKLVLWKDEI